MIKSMTGFGKAVATVNGTPCTVESRSVNGRYLELSIRLPKEWADQEAAMRDVVRDHVGRGSVNVYVRREEAAGEHALIVDKELATAYVNALRELKNELQLEGEITIGHVAAYTAIFEGEPEAGENAALTAELKDAFVRSLTSMNEMRLREGTEMARDITERVETITSHLALVQEMSRNKIPMERQRLNERIKLMVDEESYDEQRLQLEIALLADKLDISEEVVRLKSHIKHFLSDLTVGGLVGRKLNFQLQEMNREVNTIGSKSNDAEIARLVVEMKEELERMREQVQNIE